VNSLSLLLPRVISLQQQRSSLFVATTPFSHRRCVASGGAAPPFPAAPFRARCNSLVSLPAAHPPSLHHAPPATAAASPPLVLHLHFVHGHFVHLLLRFTATVAPPFLQGKFPTRFCFIFRFVYINFQFWLLRVLICIGIEIVWSVLSNFVRELGLNLRALRLKFRALSQNLRKL